jgi:hypothetical protein
MTSPGANDDADRSLLALLRCPVTGEPLAREADALVTPSGRRYPVVDGLPILTPGAARTPGSSDQPAGTGSAGAS